MTLLSALIPQRGCRFVYETVRDLIENARGNVEVIVHIDGDEPPRLYHHPRVKYLRAGIAPRGMRAGINAAAAVAQGDYLMKTDDHCAFAIGYDVALVAAHEADNWVQIPRRYSLDAEKWQINPKRPHRDYAYLCFPAKGKSHDDGIHGVEWFERQRERRTPEYDIDDTPSMQGSCYFMARAHFDRLGGMDDATFGPFAQEAQEIGLKTWLGGGAVKVNKRTWYAHLHKGKQYGRMYRFSDRANVAAINASAVYWLTDQWAERVHDFAWFVDEKFPGMPTWPANWKEVWNAAYPTMPVSA